MKGYVITLLFLSSFFYTNLYGQSLSDKEVDSLIQNASTSSTPDSIRIENFYRLARAFVFNHRDSAEYFVAQGMAISEQTNNKNGLGEAYGWMGYLNAEKGNIATAIDYNLKSLYLAEEQGLKAEYPVILNNLAQLHIDLENHEQAMHYLLECVEINKELGNEKSLATNFNNIGSFYRGQKQYKKSLAYFEKALLIRERLLEYNGLSYTYSNMGSVYEQMGDIETALAFYLKGFEIRDSLNLNKAKSTSLFKIGNIYLKQNNLKKAEEHAMKAYEIAEQWGYKYEMQEAAKILYKLYKNQNKPVQALNYFETYSSIHDSINSLENQKAILRSKYQFEYNKKHLIDSLAKNKILLENKLLDEENKVNESRIALQKLWLVIAILFIVILLILIFSIRKNTRIRMENLRAEVKLRLNETLQLKEKLESMPLESPPYVSGLNVVLQDKLTEREQEILDALVLGLSNREIAEKLFLSVNTIKTHILSLYTKLDVKNRTQAAIKGSMLHQIKENQ